MLNSGAVALESSAPVSPLHLLSCPCTLPAHVLSSGLTCAAQWVLIGTGLGQGLSALLQSECSPANAAADIRGQCGTTSCSIPVKLPELSVLGTVPHLLSQGSSCWAVLRPISSSLAQCELCTVSSVQLLLCCHSPPAAMFGEWDAGSAVPGMLAEQGGSWGIEGKLSFPKRNCASPWNLCFLMLFFPLSAVLNYLRLTGMAFCFYLRIVVWIPLDKDIVTMFLA